MRQIAARGPPAAAAAAPALQRQAPYAQRRRTALAPPPGWPLCFFSVCRARNVLLVSCSFASILPALLVDPSQRLWQCVRHKDLAGADCCGSVALAGLCDPFPRPPACPPDARPGWLLAWHAHTVPSPGRDGAQAGSASAPPRRRRRRKSCLRCRLGSLLPAGPCALLWHRPLYRACWTKKRQVQSRRTACLLSSRPGGAVWRARVAAGVAGAHHMHAVSCMRVRACLPRTKSLKHYEKHKTKIWYASIMGSSAASKSPVHLSAMGAGRRRGTSAAACKHEHVSTACIGYRGAHDSIIHRYTANACRSCKLKMHIMEPPARSSGKRCVQPNQRTCCGSVALATTRLGHLDGLRERYRNPMGGGIQASGPEQANARSCPLTPALPPARCDAAVQHH